MRRDRFLLVASGVFAVSSVLLVAAAQQVQFQTPPMPELPNNGLGETDQPFIPGQSWRIRDLNRPKPVSVAPGAHLGDPPSDAIVLFDGRDLSHWTVGGGGGRGRAGMASNTANAQPQPSQPTVPAPAPNWEVTNGYMEVTPGAGSLTSRERFRDFQLHLEFASPAVPIGNSQYRGNSGVTIGGREIQILDNYDNATYADGYVGAIYNQWPPLANPARPPGEWQTMDIAYFAARYEGDKIVRNPYITIFMNGVMIHNNREVFPSGRGASAGRSTAPGGANTTVQGPQSQGPAESGRGPAFPLGADQPIGLMGHPSAISGNAVRYRNIWVRRVSPELPTQPLPGQNP